MLYCFLLAQSSLRDHQSMTMVLAAVAQDNRIN
jgi:hypothetical protein